MKAKLIADSKALDTEIVGEKALAILSEDRLKILKAFAEPKYPAELARELRMQVQTAYYHIHMLSDAGLIKLVEFEEKSGGVAKKYQAIGDSFSVVLSEKWRPFALPQAKLPNFLKDFVQGSFLDAKFVLGSPDPHGKFRARGSEFCSLELAMYLGSFASFSYPLFLLDTEMNEKNKKENLILFGGPKVNTLVSELNSFLPIKFEEKTFTISSSLSGKKYEESVGVIELVENPWNKRKKILLVAGQNHITTRVAVLALIREGKKVEAGNLHDNKTLAKVVQGFDEDGDGIPDAVEFLE
jgi:DNA-binding transcriptional ArsR family regulator